MTRYYWTETTCTTCSDKHVMSEHKTDGVHDAEVWRSGCQCMIGEHNA